MQYTIRNVPEHLDATLRTSARQNGKSLNDVTLEALARGAGVNTPVRQQRDLSDIAGSWQEDPAFDKAISDQDSIDESLWP